MDIVFHIVAHNTVNVKTEFNSRDKKKTKENGKYLKKILSKKVFSTIGIFG
jgi:hypothetical protein